MRKYSYILVAVIMIISYGCKTKYIETIKEVHDSINIETIVRDTIFKPSKQRNSVVTTKSSFLQTDYAMSFASIDTAGLLHHSIENKNAIPSKVFYKKMFITKQMNIKTTLPPKIIKVEVVKYLYDKWF